MNLEHAHETQLVAVARDAIMQGLRPGSPVRAPRADGATPLGTPGASFVTLNTSGQLRGCCGSIEVHQPLIADVWNNARRSAFGDPRFPSLMENEVHDSTLEISILSPLSPIPANSEREVLTAIRPGVDGVLMSLGQHRATFLPKVWDKLPRPEQFLVHLKRKLGVADDFWDESLVFERYTTHEFGGALSDSLSVSAV